MFRFVHHHREHGHWSVILEWQVPHKMATYSEVKNFLKIR